MANEPVITVCGNLTGDPELRFTPNGAAVANLTIASTPRTFDKQANEWVDGETLFLRASVWREAAENVAGSLKKGMRVIYVGVSSLFYGFYLSAAAHWFPFSCCVAACAASVLSSVVCVQWQFSHQVELYACPQRTPS